MREVVKMQARCPLNTRISSAPEQGGYYAAESKITARLGSEMFTTMVRVQQGMPDLKLPLLIMQGTGDKLVSPEGARLLHTRAGSADRTLKMYDGFYHELFNEPDREKVFADLVPWLDSHI